MFLVDLGISGRCDWAVVAAGIHARGKITTVEGEGPKRLTVIQFESAAKAEAWEDSAARNTIRLQRRSQSPLRGWDLWEGGFPALACRAKYNRRSAAGVEFHVRCLERRRRGCN